VQLAFFNPYCVPDVTTQGPNCATLLGALAGKNQCQNNNLNPKYAGMQCCYD